MIEYSNVSFKYDTEEYILKGLTFTINDGESIGIIGANGAGKSTMIRLMLGLCDTFDGKISVQGLDVNKKNIREIRKKAGYVMQEADNQLFMPTVYEDICFGPVNYGYSGEDTERAAHKAMELTGITHLKDKPPYKLSFGEKKLAAIATILSMEPEIIIMDEPESGLDPANRARITDVVKLIDTTKIIVSHDLDFIWNTTDRVILLGNGEIKAFDDTQKVLSDESLMNKYSLMVPNCAIIKMFRDKLDEMS